MKAATEKVLKEFQQAVAEYYAADVDRVIAGKTFSIDTPKAIHLLGNIQKKSDFLSKINYVQVDDIAGQLIFGATESLITGRKENARNYGQVSPTGTSYQCVEMDSGVLIPWARLDQWGHLAPNFAKMWADYVQRQIALDEIQIGFYGESVATNTSDPQGKDVNKGWMQFARDNKPSQILTEGKTSNEIHIFGDEGDYKNLDELAYDLRQGLHERHRDAGDLVFLVGADLVAKEASTIYRGNGLIATEKAALNTQTLMKTFGGMPSMMVPNLPARAAIVTSLDNLSIYVQKGSIRRSFREDQESKAIKDSYYRNAAYVVEDLGKFAAIEFKNVKLLDSDGTYK
ncbi:phage major capsid protein, P2 family [Avibacterium sp. 21-595]|uniref:phage major capsid protein, P2 family n=1 Tax=Avibacterium sp. 21-595 TaxID=2911527 RepID=UPI002025EB75|nr:phage major capsid protein, P2 family [Avibacterium sp. 21-595]URL05953.1 phage major capsid protein, P2 family [Avibacterium sp. 21-595]